MDDIHGILDDAFVKIKEIDEETAEFFSVMSDALITAHSRGKLHGRGLWKRHGWKGSVMQVMSKTARLQRHFWEDIVDRQTTPDDLDDAYDLINYAVFFILNVQGKNEYGS